MSSLAEESIHNALMIKDDFNINSQTEDNDEEHKNRFFDSSFFHNNLS
jgi:hypothetical protein